MRWIGVLVSVAAAMTIAFSVGILTERASLLSGQAGGTTASGSGPSGSNEFELVDDAYGLLKEHYIDQSALDRTKLTYGAVRGLVDAVGDTGHTRFLTPDELKAQQSGLSGTVEGIGALLSSQNEQPIVQSVVPGGPADRAGLRSGDRIVAIDGESVAGLSLDEIVTRVRGEPGTSVTVSVIRDAGAPIDVTILRETVTVPATTWTIVPGTTTALIRLEQFSTGSADQLKESIKASREAGATGILLDLRENPGGYVNEAVTIASQFLRDGTVYLSQDAKGARTPTAVEPGGLALDTPLVVLVNGGSASSSEIVAGALKDAGRARLVGTRTFGTGTVLGQFALSDGSALMIGTIQWLTPKGNEIWHQGITPDVVIDMPSGGRVLAPTDVAKLDPANLLSAGDPQLVEALKVIASIQRTSEPASLLFRRAA